MKQPQNRVDFGRGTLPVCGRQREKRKSMNANARRSLDDAACRLRSRAMAGGTRQTPRSGPAAVAIRNDGHVEPRNLVNGRLRDRNLTYCLVMHEHVLSPPRNKRHKLLCNTKHIAKKFCPLSLRAS